MGKQNDLDLNLNQIIHYIITILCNEVDRGKIAEGTNLNHELCEFSIQVNKENFDLKEINILNAYGYKKQYVCPLTKQKKNQFCRFHLKDTNDKDGMLAIDDFLKFAELPIPESNKQIEDESNLSPYLFVKCRIPNIKFPEKTNGNQIEKLIFIKCEFNDLNGQQSDFYGITTLQCHFKGKVNFRNAHFGKGGVNFGKAQFGEGGAYFGGAQFGEGGAYFVGAQFGKGGAHFRNVQFGKGGAYFTDAQIGEGGAHFFGAQFGESTAYFVNVQFGEGKAYFVGAQFGKGGAHFGRAKFGEGGADFSYVQFGEGGADFSYVQFEQGVANFSFVKFGQGVANFSYVEFNNKVHFDSAEFQNVKFEENVFRKAVSFIKTRFLGICIFDNVIFNSQVRFNLTQFIINFKNQINKKEDIFKNRIVCFHDCFFLKPKLVGIDEVNFSYVSFIGTDVSAIELGRITWLEFEKNRLLFDEILYKDRKEKNSPDTSNFIEAFGQLGEIKRFLPEGLDEVLSVYRRFRQTLEYSSEYTAAGQFFYREMELKRWVARYSRNELNWDKKRSISEYSILSGYKWISGYGENLFRSVIWIPIVIILFTVLTTLYHSIFLSGSLSIRLFENQFSLSLGLFFQVTEVSKETFYLDVLERVTSIIVVANLIIASRRRFERKIRL